VQSDGNDIAEVVRLASEAFQRAHAGEGPTFLEFKTYRYRDHVGPDFDNSLGYRGDEEFKAWAARDPIKHLNESLVKQGVLSQQTNEAIVKEIKAEVAEAFVFALSSPFPSQHTNLLDSVYAKNGTGSVSNG
jgi:pyruvate dehydrogenase E1 component alpha subunit